MLDDWKTEKVLTGLAKMKYDKEAVHAIEDENWDLFRKHSEYAVKAMPDHVDTLRLAFGDKLKGTGALDIGSGPSGVFCLDHLNNCFNAPRHNIDIFKPALQNGWVTEQCCGQEALAKFGANSFDYIQCIETLEHVPKLDALQIASDMITMSRKFCLITSAGIGQHLGQETTDIIEVNKNMDYIGQPDIEALMQMGYSVRLVGDNAQIVAWHINESSM